MDEAKVREIHFAIDLQEYSHAELIQCDRWIKDYALAKLSKHIRADVESRALREWIMTVARAHYGSAETDLMLEALSCYPAWMKPSRWRL